MLIYLIALLFFASCSQKQAIHSINLFSPEKSEVTLSEIADSIAYYPIFLEKGSLIPNHIELLTNTIWVSYYLKDLSEQKGRLFNRINGHLLNQMSLGPIINKKKYAFSGYYTNSYFIFNNEEWLSTPPAPKSKSNHYTINAVTGKEVEAIPFSIRDIKSQNPQRINDSTFLVLTDLIGIRAENTVRPNYSIQWYDTQMQLIKEDHFTDSVYLINRLKIISLLKDKIYIHADCTSTIYELSRDKKPVPIYQYFLGEYKPSIAQNSKLLATGNFKMYYSSPYYNLRSSMIAEKFVFGAFDYKGNIYNILYNRNTEKTWIIPTQGKSDILSYPYKEGVKNDLDGGLDFWPRNISKQGEIYTWYNIEDLRAKISQSNSKQMKNPEAARRLKEMLNNLPEEVNYVIAVLKEKN